MAKLFDLVFFRFDNIFRTAEDEDEEVDVCDVFDVDVDVEGEVEVETEDADVSSFQSISHRDISFEIPLCLTFFRLFGSSAWLLVLSIDRLVMVSLFTFCLLSFMGKDSGEVD